MENTDYREIYKRHTGKDIPKDFEIHHIDFNRKNNDIENLVALPKEVHQEYHKRFKDMPIDTTLTIKILPIYASGREFNKYCVERINAFLEIWEICNKWCDYRDYLRGILPNIHDIEIEE